jgi:hypothetical protein
MADSYLRCTICGRTSTTDFASSLRTGWERCCGYTMRLERTDADIEAAVGSVVGQASELSRKEPS